LLSGCCKGKYFKSKNDPIQIEQRIAHKVKSMIVVGFRDEDLDYMLSKNKFGGVILFAQDLLTGVGRNVYSREVLEKNMQKLQNAGIKFIAVDQEGGKALNDDGSVIDLKYRGVNRLYKIDDFNKMPFPGDLLKMKKNDRRKTLNYYAKKIKDLGFTVNFVPTVDIKINKDPDFFLNRKKRILADNVKDVVDVSSDVIDLHRKNGLITSVKHFPGHGSAMNDSHDGFVDITNTWSEKELEPYKSLIAKNKVDIVMVGHLFNAKIDDVHPSSISKNTIDDLLRKKLGYDGVVVSDAIDMQALANKYSLEEIVINAINAGNDIVLHANQMSYDKDIAEKIYNIIIKAVVDGKVAEWRVHKSYKRIEGLYKVFDGAYINKRKLSQVK